MDEVNARERKQTKELKTNKISECHYELNLNISDC